MENILLITEALNYIETNLTENIRTEDIAGCLYCSKSTIEKLFRYMTRTSIRDYIIRRRMTLAAKDIRESGCDGVESTFLNLALKYGYSSNEAFTRAFKSVWHVTPTEYRCNPSKFDLFPAFKLDPDFMEEDTMSDHKKVDISELYDYVKARRNCYFVGVDIVNLIPINEISREAGDVAIITALNRLSDASGENDIVFRVGGDEFVALTSSQDVSYAESIAEKVLAHNGETFDYCGRKIPLSLYVTCYKIENQNICYSELLSQMQRAIFEEKRKQSIGL